MLYNITLIADADGVSFMDEVHQQSHDLKEFEDEVREKFNELGIDFLRYETMSYGFIITVEFIDHESIELKFNVDNNGKETIRDFKGDMHHICQYSKLGEIAQRVSKRVTEIMQAA
jgi:hypothetical protein